MSGLRLPLTSRSNLRFAPRTCHDDERSRSDAARSARDAARPIAGPVTTATYHRAPAVCTNPETRTAPAAACRSATAAIVK